MLQIIKTALDTVSLTVEHLVVVYGSLAGTVRGDQDLLGNGAAQTSS